MLARNSRLLRERLSEYDASRIPYVRDNKGFFCHREGYGSSAAVLAIETSLGLHCGTYLSIAFCVEAFDYLFIEQPHIEHLLLGTKRLLLLRISGWYQILCLGIALDQIKEFLGHVARDEVTHEMTMRAVAIVDPKEPVPRRTAETLHCNVRILVCLLLFSILSSWLRYHTVLEELDWQLCPMEMLLLLWNHLSLHRRIHRGHTVS